MSSSDTGQRLRETRHSAKEFQSALAESKGKGNSSKSRVPAEAEELDPELFRAHTAVLRHINLDLARAFGRVDVHNNERFLFKLRPSVPGRLGDACKVGESFETKCLAKSV